MKIRNIIAACLLASVAFISASGRTRDFDFTNCDLGITMGVNVPMYSDLGSDFITGVTFGKFKDNGIGFRTGIQFAPNSSKFGNSFGIPIAFAYRFQDRDPWTRSTSVSKRDFPKRDILNEPTRSFLSAVFQDTELLVGLTPGYVPGKYNIDRKDSRSSSDTDSWTRKWTKCEDNFSVSFDAGLSLNYPIWRFDLKVMPAFHYNLTNNYYIYTSEGNTTSGEDPDSIEFKPVKWFFSLNLGLAFKF